MPGLQVDGVVAALGSPIKKSKLSLKFFQKKDTKRALDFSETQSDEQNGQPLETEEPASFDQVVPGPCPASPITCERRDIPVPFVGLNNLGNTCYLNSILQVLYYCPGFKEAIKKLYKLSKGREKPKEGLKNEEQQQQQEEAGGPEAAEQAPSPALAPSPAQLELLGSFHSLITSLEQLQSKFLISPSMYSEGELATPPRKLLNSLRQLNPMYEGYLQHDAQEVLQCILGYIQEACDIIRKEDPEEEAGPEKTESEEEGGGGADGQVSGKRKSDTEAGNAKKKPKSQTKSRNADQEEPPQQPPLARSKRKSSGDISIEGEHVANGKTREEEEDQTPGETDKKEKSNVEEQTQRVVPKETGKSKKRARLSWLRSASSSTSSGKQTSLFSKFRSMGRHQDSRPESREEQGQEAREPHQDQSDTSTATPAQANGKPQPGETQSLDVLKSLFQGQLVLRTRCLECECFTERREDFQDISVPVQEDEQAPSETTSEISPDPKPELKTLKWAISQFASVERIVGEDKYFCETCHHYTEAERSLLFDKTPDVITIHLKCFAANSCEFDPYAGLSKVNTPLQTPLQLSLEEWSTGAAASGRQYQLFAVVMHSGVTISSGHYTTYVRMSDLHRLSLSVDGAAAGEDDGDGTQAAKKEEEVALGATQEYDDGEVSFSLSGRGGASASAASPAAKAGAKKPQEVVGLLGGQRSLATYDLGGGSSKQQQAGADKSTFPSLSAAGGKREKDAVTEAMVGEQRCAGGGLALQNLLDYEGKWLLFDDSEVRLYEEEDFLRACSPETCSTSTPYLLFYRRVAERK